MKPTLLKTLAAGLTLAALTFSPANAAVIATESFQDYTGTTPQDLNAKNGGSGWTSAWSIAGGADTAQVQAPGDNSNEIGNELAPSGGLTFSNGSISRDGGDRLGSFGSDMSTSVTNGMGRTFSATSADTVYLSLLWYPDNKESYRFGLADSDKDTLGVEYSSAGMSVRVREPDGSPSNFGDSVSVTSRETHLLVIKYDKSTSGTGNPYTDVSLFLDPDSTTEPTTADSSLSISNFDSAPTSLDRVHFTEYSTDGALDAFIDDVQVTTTFGEAVTAIPEPSSLSLILSTVVGATLLLRRRRR